MWKVSIMLIALIAGSLGNIWEERQLKKEREACVKECKAANALEMEFDDYYRVCKCLVVRNPGYQKPPINSTVDDVTEKTNLPNSSSNTMEVVNRPGLQEANKDMEAMNKFEIKTSPELTINSMGVVMRPRPTNSEVKVIINDSVMKIMNRPNVSNSDMGVTVNPQQVINNAEMEGTNHPDVPNNSMGVQQEPNSKVLTKNPSEKINKNGHEIKKPEVPNHNMGVMSNAQASKSNTSVMDNSHLQDINRTNIQNPVEPINRPQTPNSNIEIINNPHALSSNVVNPQARLNLELIRHMIETPREKRRIANSNDANEPIVGAIRPLVPKFRAVKPGANLRHHVITEPKVRKLHFDHLRRNAAVKHDLAARTRAFARPLAAPELRTRVALNKARHPLVRPAILGSTANNGDSSNTRGSNLNFRSKSNFENGDEDAPQKQNRPNKHIITQPQEFMEN